MSISHFREFLTAIVSYMKSGFNSVAARLCKKGKGNKKGKVDPKNMCNYYKEPGHWQKDFPKNKKKDYFVVVVPNDSSLENNLVLDIGEQPQQHFEQ